MFRRETGSVSATSVSPHQVVHHHCYWFAGRRLGPRIAVVERTTPRVHQVQRYWRLRRYRIRSDARALGAGSNSDLDSDIRHRRPDSHTYVRAHSKQFVYLNRLISLLDDLQGFRSALTARGTSILYQGRSIASQSTFNEYRGIVLRQNVLHGQVRCGTAGTLPDLLLRLWCNVLDQEMTVLKSPGSVFRVGTGVL